METTPELILGAPHPTTCYGTITIVNSRCALVGKNAHGAHTVTYSFDTLLIPFAGRRVKCALYVDEAFPSWECTGDVKRVPTSGAFYGITGDDSTLDKILIPELEKYVGKEVHIEIELMDTSKSVYGYFSTVSAGHSVVSFPPFREEHLSALLPLFKEWGFLDGQAVVVKVFGPIYSQSEGRISFGFTMGELNGDARIISNVAILYDGILVHDAGWPPSQNTVLWILDYAFSKSQASVGKAPITLVFELQP